MLEATNGVLLALAANVSFATASIAYASYAKSLSAYWMNTFKTSFAFFLLALVAPVIWGLNPVDPKSLMSFFSSGLIGLNLGDLFLLAAFARIGAARTLILFSFQPFFLAAAGYYFFDQNIFLKQIFAIFFMLACLFLFSLEGYRKNGKWELQGLLFALMGVLLDTSGILLTRWGFDQSVGLQPIEGHLYRCFGALMGFVIMAQFIPIHLIKKFQSLSPKAKVIVCFASFLGTFLSLLFYMTAVQTGHLASISAVAITGPLFAAGLEALIQKRKPSIYFLLALGFFICGFIILL